MKGLIDSANKAAPLRDRRRQRRLWPSSRPVQRALRRTRDHASRLSRGSGQQGRRCGDHRVARSLACPHGAGRDRGRQGRVSGETGHHTISRKAPVLTKAVRSSKQVLQCGMQQRSWAHFRDAVDLVQGGSLGRVVQVRTYWWQNYHTNWPMKADRPAGARLESVAGLSAGASVQRREVQPLALVLELRWRRHDRLIHALDRRRALGDESRPAAPGLHAGRQIRLRTSGIVPIRFRRHSAIPDSMWCTKA